MAFSLKTWVNRISEYPNRRKLTHEDGSTELVTVARAEGQISAEGNAFSAEEMNDLENRIKVGFDEVNRSLTNIPIFRCGRIRVSYDSPQYLKANVVFDKEMPSYDYSVAIGIDSNVLDCIAIYYENRSVHGFGISIYKADANFTSVDGVNLSWIVAM